MNPEMAVSLGRQAAELVLMLCGPGLLLGLAVGVLVSIVQAATQINEQTLTFIPKLVVTLITLVVGGPWMMSKLLAFFQAMLDQVALLP